MSEDELVGHPMRRADDIIEADSITEAELPRYLYRELKRLKRQLGRAMTALRELEQAVFGHQDGTEWVKGLSQNLAEMRQLAGENHELLQASRRWLRRLSITATVATAVLALDGLHPGWGDALLKAFGLHI